tara:strand:- start:1426 stop:2073 length:648 start_codon:yes stop_codon:yes gene_type:complete
MKKLFCKLVISLALVFSTTPAYAVSTNPQVLFKTDKGDFLVELYPKKAPVSVDSFIKHVKGFHYDGLIFHRVINKFMIQTGGFTFDMTSRTSDRPMIVNESDNGLKNKRGTLAMARTSDPDSALAQFFINHKYNRFLDYKEGRPGYAVFGKVISGLAIVDSIAVVETTNVKGYADVPVEPIRILSARLLNPEAVTLLPEQKKEKKPVFERPIPIR